MENFLNEKEVNEIVKFYSKLSKFVLKFGAYISFFCLSFFFFVFADFSGNYKIFSQSGNNLNSNPVGIEEIGNGFRGDMVYFTGKGFSYSGGEIKLLDGNVFSSGESIYSKDNLVLFSGYTLPRKFKVERKKVFNLKDIDYFKGKYEIQYLEDFMDEFVFYSNEIEKSNSRNEKKEIENTFKRKFGLSCVSSSFNLVNEFCKRNINQFLREIKYYDLNKFIGEYQEVFFMLAENGYKKEMCDATIKNIYFTYSVEENINRKILSECGSSDKEIFRKLQAFKTIRENLKRGMISDTTYNKGNYLNEYKLISFQRNIYEQIENNNLDLSFVDTYMDFVTNVTTDGKVRDFYVDLTYLYNNQYLKEKLKERKDKGRVKEDIKDLISEIKQKNSGNNTPLYAGLERKVVNTKLKDYIKEKKHPSGGKNTASQSLSEVFDATIERFNNITLFQREIDGEEKEVLASMKFVFEGNEKVDKKKEIRATLAFKQKNNSFPVRNIKLEDRYSGLESILREKMKEGMFLREVKEVMKNNVFLSEKGDFNFCKVFTERKKEELEKDVNIKKCNKDLLNAQRGDVSYTFSFENNLWQDFSVSHKEIENNFSGVVKDPVSKENSIGDILNILSYQKEKSESESIPTSVLRNLTNKFNEFLNTEPIVRKPEGKYSDKYRVIFSLNGIDFRGVLDINNNYKMSDLRFVVEREEGKIQEEVKIEGFEVYLISKDKLKINKLKDDVLGFIEKIDESAVKEYKEAIEN